MTSHVADGDDQVDASHETPQQREKEVSFYVPHRLFEVGQWTPPADADSQMNIACIFRLNLLSTMAACRARHGHYALSGMIESHE